MADLGSILPLRLWLSTHTDGIVSRGISEGLRSAAFLNTCRPRVSRDASPFLPNLLINPLLLS